MSPAVTRRPVLEGDREFLYRVYASTRQEELAVVPWTDDERDAFTFYIAANPEAGDLVPRSGGLRKVRWSYAGRGKRGGVRVIYYNRLADGEIWLLLIYGKSVREQIPAHVLRQIREEIENG